MIAAQDLSSDNPDEKSVMTYLFYYCCRGSPGQLSLLQWINTVIPEQKVTNFTSDWKDGEAICNLVEAFLPYSIPPSTSIGEKFPLARVQLAMGVAEDRLGIEQTLSPEDFVNPSVDQTISMMTYLTQFRFHEDKLPVTRRLTAMGPGITGAKTGSDVPLYIHGKVPSDNDLAITITGPEGSIVNLEQIALPTSDLAYRYVPEIPGEYVIDVTCSGEHISGSPYFVTHANTSHAENCIVSGKGLRRAYIRKPTKFIVDASSAGIGNLEVEVHDPKSKDVPVTVQRKEGANEGGEYVVTFIPKVLGEHWIFVSWGGEDIPDSPFTCAVSNPSACIASGQGLYSSVVGKPSRFQVKTSGAGPGHLSATLYGPSKPIELTLQSNISGTYIYEYTPEQTGSYVIDIKWNGFPVPGCPFTAKTLLNTSEAPRTPAESCFVKERHVGSLRVMKPASVLVDSSAAPATSLHATVRSTNSEDECEVVKVEEGGYGVMFVPHHVGQYTMTILCNGIPIPDSPLVFSVNDPSKCSVDSYYGTAQVDTPISFKVTTSNAGEGQLKATIQGPSRDLAVFIQEESDGDYVVSFTPQVQGTYVIDLFFDGEPFLVSPLEFKVEGDKGVFAPVKTPEQSEDMVDFIDRKKKEEESIVVTKQENIVVTKPETTTGFFPLGSMQKFHMYAPQRNPDSFEFIAIGEKTHTVPAITLISTGENTYDIHYMASQPDDYTMVIKYEDSHVPGSPFTLKFCSPPDPSSVQAFDPIKQFKA